MSRLAVQRAVVLGIWGRGGGDGIPGFINLLAKRLVRLGVSSNNIFSMSWNPEQNDNPFGIPATEQHKEALFEREQPPLYIALIGHSYGGWAVCSLSRILERKSNFIGLLDPVFGPSGDSEEIVKPFGDNIHNWYQRNSITEPLIIEDCTGTVVGCPNGISCGRHIDGINNHEVKWRKDWDGKILMRNCGITEKPRHAFHLNIDSDRYIWRLIIEQIESDINGLINQE